MLDYLNSVFTEEKIDSKSRILELGCGNGCLTAPLVQKGLNVTGIDISPTAIEWAKEKAREQNLKIDLMVGDCLDLPYPDNSFDLAIDSHCFHCIIGDDRRTFLNNVYRVVRCSGLLVIMTMCNDPNEDSVLKFFDRESRCMVVNGIAGRYFGPTEDILNEVVNSGFKIKQWKVIPPINDDQDELCLVAEKL